MALGDVNGARKYFRNFIAEIDILEAKLLAKGRQLPEVLAWHRDYDAKELLYILDNFYGEHPSVDLDIGCLWATKERVSLEESAGKVVAILFQPFYSPRSLPFLTALDRLEKEHEKNGLVAGTFSLLIEESTEDALATMHAKLIEAGVSLSSGYDRSGNSIFHAFQATLGSASFVVVDRKGRYAWFLHDPSGRNWKLAERVVLRLLAESST
jgi:hypothetical protein